MDFGGVPTGALEIALLKDEAVAELNARHRDLPECTDVLSFPAPAEAAPYLGEIAIAVGFADRQAQLRGVALDTELAYLVIHGTLHLLGFDDETEADRSTMFAAMDAIGASMGLPHEPEWQSVLLVANT